MLAASSDLSKPDDNGPYGCLPCDIFHDMLDDPFGLRVSLFGRRLGVVDWAFGHRGSKLGVVVY